MLHFGGAGFWLVVPEYRNLPAVIPKHDLSVITRYNVFYNFF